MDESSEESETSDGDDINMTGSPTHPHVDMCVMPIWSETTKINTAKTKRSKMCEGPGQPVLLGPPTCKCDKIYNEYNEI
jgi:hypothetical protein